VERRKFVRHDKFPAKNLVGSYAVISATIFTQYSWKLIRIISRGTSDRLSQGEHSLFRPPCGGRSVGPPGGIFDEQAATVERVTGRRHYCAHHALSSS